MATLVAKKLIRSNLCRGMENKEPMNIFVSPINKKKVLPWQHLLPGVGEKLISSNLLRGMESKGAIKIFTSPKVLPVIVVKLVSSNLCRGLESKEQQKNFLSPRNMKKCCHGNICGLDIVRKAITHKFS